MKAFFSPLWRQVALWRSALAWLGTPFADHQRIAGAGVDCVQLAGAVYIATGLLDRFDPAPYTIDGGDHLARSRVLDWLDSSPRFARSSAALLAGDLLAFKQGRASHHVGIVLATDGLNAAFLHAQRLDGAVIQELADSTWSRRLVAAYTPLER